MKVCRLLNKQYAFSGHQVSSITCCSAGFFGASSHRIGLFSSKGSLRRLAIISQDPSHIVTAVACRGELAAVGTSLGQIQLWRIGKQTLTLISAIALWGQNEPIFTLDLSETWLAFASGKSVVAVDLKKIPRATGIHPITPITDDMARMALVHSEIVTHVSIVGASLLVSASEDGCVVLSGIQKLNGLNTNELAAYNLREPEDDVNMDQDWFLGCFALFDTITHVLARDTGFGCVRIGVTTGSNRIGLYRYDLRNEALEVEFQDLSISGSIFERDNREPSTRGSLSDLADETAPRVRVLAAVEDPTLSGNLFWVVTRGDGKSALIKATAESVSVVIGFTIPKKLDENGWQETRDAVDAVHGSEVQCFGVNPKGVLASGDDSGTICFWSINNWCGGGGESPPRAGSLRSPRWHKGSKPSNRRFDRTIE